MASLSKRLYMFYYKFNQQKTAIFRKNHSVSISEERSDFLDPPPHTQQTSLAVEPSLGWKFEADAHLLSGSASYQSHP